jgi:hypothetical protein
MSLNTRQSKKIFEIEVVGHNDIYISYHAANFERQAHLGGGGIYLTSLNFPVKYELKRQKHKLFSLCFIKFGPKLKSPNTF